MTYGQNIHETRNQIVKCVRNVEAQRARLVQLRDIDGDTWLAQRLLAASEEALKSYRERLRDLLLR